MIFSEIGLAISTFINSLKEKLLAFYDENKKLSLLISGLIVIILICLLLLICIAPSSKKSKESEEKQPFVLSEPLQIPNGPEMPDDYNISRITEATWSEDEAEPWFTIPSEKEINALSQTNNTMINELLGAAP